jgi:hypothetical protein
LPSASQRSDDGIGSFGTALWVAAAMLALLGLVGALERRRFHRPAI